MYYGGVVMISVRLSDELEEKINKLSSQENLTKSDIIKKALENYFEEKEEQTNPYELGEDLFGKHGSEKGKLSKSYKEKVREKINEKNPH